MNVADGKISFDETNTELTNEINQVITKSIQSSTYPKDVQSYLRDFNEVKKFNSDIHKSVNDLSTQELNDLINPIQKQTVEQTLNGLTGAGVNTNFIDPLKEGMFKNIVAGSSKSDLEQYLSNYILTDPERLGQFKKYVGQVSRDALNQFDGQVNSRIAEEFELDAFQYVGSLIDDSRPQCQRWVRKGVLLKEELPGLISSAYNNGTGMIPGTNSENFAVFRGGYNCRHSAIPFKLTKRERERLGLEQAKEEEELSKEPISKENQGLPLAEQRFKDLNSIKSSKTPESLKKFVSAYNVPEVIFDLSDNGKTNVKGSKSYYIPEVQEVTLSLNSKRFKNNNISTKQVIIHEFAHRTHFERGFFGYNSKTTNPIHKKHFEESRKIVLPKVKNLDLSTKSLLAKYKDILPNLTKSDLEEFIGSYADTVSSLTFGNFGWGHGKKYFKQYGGVYGPFEWFAHASENYFIGNPVFQGEFPELFDQMNDYFDKEVINELIDKKLLNE